jgi:RNA recognition motif-containing protein
LPAKFVPLALIYPPSVAEARISAAMEADPNQTIYVKNINEKVKKDVLKKQLYMLFSQYGRVKQIVACKGIKLRGQVKFSICVSLVACIKSNLL